MDSIGNDIIALNSIDISRTRNSRFYTKILAPAEQQLYHNHFGATPFEQFVWLLWSIKESAYKYLQRHQPDLVFTPVKVAVIGLDLPAKNVAAFPQEFESTGFRDDECFKSILRFGSQTLYARSVIYGNDLIHSVVSNIQSFGNINWGIKRISQTDPESQSSAVREFLLDKLRPAFPDKQPSIGKHTSGCPFVALDGKDTGIIVSLSHHGEWVGYSYAAMTIL